MEKSCYSKALGIGAKALIFKNNKWLILIKNNGRPDLPGGKINLNEIITEGLKREIFEETKLTVMNIKPIAQWSFFKKVSGLFIIGTTFACHCSIGNVKLSEEHRSYYWIPIEDIPKINFQPDYGLNQVSGDSFNSRRQKDLLWQLPQINY